MTDGRAVPVVELLETFDERAPDGLRCPPHSLTVARERVESGVVCPAGSHEWITLDGYYWRECRACGLADVTVADLGQPVATPGVDD